VLQVLAAALAEAQSLTAQVRLQRPKATPAISTLIRVMAITTKKTQRPGIVRQISEALLVPLQPLLALWDLREFKALQAPQGFRVSQDP
jgi:hypothetical protein